jgi:hypothetical protein
MSGRDLVRDLRSIETPPPKQSARGVVVDVLIGAIAVLAVASFGYFGYAAWLAPHAAAPRAVAAVAGPEPQPIPKAPKPAPASADAGWTEADASRCQAAARAAAENPEVPPEAMLAQRSVTEGFAGLATRVECQITTKVARFCAPEGKAQLVAMVQDYLDRRDLVILGMGVQGAPMAIAGEMFGGEMAAGRDIYNIEKEGTFALMRVYHTRVAAALQSLVRDGVVTQADFGSFMGMGVPSSIKDILKGVKAEQNICKAAA